MNSGNGKLIDGELSGTVIGAFYNVYNALGYGFLESVYGSAMVLELSNRGLKVEREVPIQVYYEDEPIAMQKIDILVERRLVVELKASRILADPERKQLFNYLRATDLQLGLLFHFGPVPSFYRVISTSKHQSVIVPPNPFNSR